MMDDMIINVSTLPEPLFSGIHCDKVLAREVNGEIILTPLAVSDAINEIPKRKQKLKFCFVDLPPLPDSFFDPLPEEELQLWGL